MSLTLTLSDLTEMIDALTKRAAQENGRGARRNEVTIARLDSAGATLAAAQEALRGQDGALIVLTIHYDAQTTRERVFAAVQAHPDGVSAYHLAVELGLSSQGVRNVLNGLYTSRRVGLRTGPGGVRRFVPLAAEGEHGSVDTAR